MMTAPRLLTLATFLITTSISRGGQEQGNAQSEQPANPNAIAERAYSRGQFADVLKITEKQLKEKPDDHVARYFSASALVEIGRQTRNSVSIRQGIEDARKAIELSKGQTSRYYLPYLYGMSSLTEIEGDKRHAEQALVAAGQALAKETVSENKGHLFYHRARAHAVLNQHQKAQNDFREAIRRDPKLLAAWMGLADSLSAADNPKQARETFDEAARKFSRNPLVFNNRGLFLQEIEEYELAVADFTTALQLNPRFVAAHTNRGYTLLAMDDPEAAELDFAASLGLEPRQPMVLRLRAGCRLLQNQPTTAIEDLTASMALRADVSVHIDLGFAKLMNGSYKEAAELLGKAQEMEPGLQHVRPWRLAALLATGTREPALKEYAAAIARVKANAKDCAWSDWLCGFLSDSIDSARLLQIASSDPEKKTGRLTEANFFLGLRAEMGKDAAVAFKAYKQSLAGGRKDLAAYRGALIGAERTKSAGARK